MPTLVTYTVVASASYVVLAVLDRLSYVLRGNDTPCPDAILKLHWFEFGTKVNTPGTDRVGIWREVLVQDFKCTVLIFVNV